MKKWERKKYSDDGNYGMNIEKRTKICASLKLDKKEISVHAVQDWTRKYFFKVCEKFLGKCSEKMLRNICKSWGIIVK